MPNDLRNHALISLDDGSAARASSGDRQPGFRTSGHVRRLPIARQSNLRERKKERDRERERMREREREKKRERERLGLGLGP